MEAISRSKYTSQRRWKACGKQEKRLWWGPVRDTCKRLLCCIALDALALPYPTSDYAGNVFLGDPCM